MFLHDTYIDAFVNEPQNSSFTFWKLVITSSVDTRVETKAQM
jgi:hypothetical protein